MQYEAEVRACGIPVTVEFDTQAADPDVGYYGGIDDWQITRINGRKVKGDGAKWLEDKLYKKPGDYERFTDELWESRHG